MRRTTAQRRACALAEAHANSTCVTWRSKPNGSADFTAGRADWDGLANHPQQTVAYACADIAHLRIFPWNSSSQKGQHMQASNRPASGWRDAAIAWIDGPTTDHNMTESGRWADSRR